MPTFDRHLAYIRYISAAPECCSTFQCVPVCCSVLQCVVVCCSVLQCVAVCFRNHTSDMPLSCVLQCVLCAQLLQCVAECCRSSIHVRCRFHVCCNVLHTQCTQLAVCCSVLQCVAVCCSVLQCVAVRCTISVHNLDTHVRSLSHVRVHTLQKTHWSGEKMGFAGCGGRLGSRSFAGPAIYMCDMTRSHQRYDIYAFVCVCVYIYMCDMTHSHQRYDMYAFVCVCVYIYVYTHILWKSVGIVQFCWPCNFLV